MNLSAQSRLLILALAIAAVVLVVVGFILVGDHPKRGMLAFALAFGSAVGAGFVVRRAARST